MFRIRLFLVSHEAYSVAWRMLRLYGNRQWGENVAPVRLLLNPVTLWKGKPMSDPIHSQLTVVGAGPAGLAAYTAAEAGCRLR
jgi:hypothetical protein